MSIFRLCEHPTCFCNGVSHPSSPATLLVGLDINFRYGAASALRSCHLQTLQGPIFRKEKSVKLSWKSWEIIAIGSGMFFQALRRLNTGNLVSNGAEWQVAACFKGLCHRVVSVR